jgi:transposase-like protein
MQPVSYARHQFPAEIIRHAVWLYLRFTLSYRDVEELLAERGIEISYETVRRWVLKFGPMFAHNWRPAATQADWQVALGRDGGLDPGPAHVPVASRRQ